MQLNEQTNIEQVPRASLNELTSTQLRREKLKTQEANIKELLYLLAHAKYQSLSSKLHVITTLFSFLGAAASASFSMNRFYFAPIIARLPTEVANSIQTLTDQFSHLHFNSSNHQVLCSDEIGNPLINYAMNGFCADPIIYPIDSDFTQQCLPTITEFCNLFNEYADPITDAVNAAFHSQISIVLASLAGLMILMGLILYTKEKVGGYLQSDESKHLNEVLDEDTVQRILTLINKINESNGFPEPFAMDEFAQVKDVVEKAIAFRDEFNAKEIRIRRSNEAMTFLKGYYKKSGEKITLVTPEDEKTIGGATLFYRDPDRDVAYHILKYVYQPSPKP